MKEARFISLNKERWKDYETELTHSVYSNPDDLARRYIQILDDLSYARTFFPESSTVSYLNALALKSHGQIYVTRKEQWKRLLAFWKVDLPYLFYRYRRYILYSAIIFLFSALIGALSAAGDSTFVRLILGDDYINMTLDNIDKGDPMGVYASSGAIVMFFMIVINNIQVSFVTSVMGIFTTMATAIYIFYNGIMLGSLEMFFWQKGLFIVSLRSILLHGVIEISSLIIAGATGWMLGNALLFPGTYKRVDSLLMKGRDAVKIVFGLMPLFIIAGFIESFIARYTKMPAALSYSIILTTSAFIVWYVILLPIKINKRLTNGTGK